MWTMALIVVAMLALGVLWVAAEFNAPRGDEFRLSDESIEYWDEH